MTELTEQQIENAYNAFWKRSYECNLPWNEQGEEEQYQFRMRIENAAPHVQYAPTEPGAPMSDEEKREIKDICGCNVMPWGAINTVLAKRNVPINPPKMEGDDE